MLAGTGLITRTTVCGPATRCWPSISKSFFLSRPVDVYVQENMWFIVFTVRANHMTEIQKSSLLDNFTRDRFPITTLAVYFPVGLQQNMALKWAICVYRRRLRCCP